MIKRTQWMALALSLACAGAMFASVRSARADDAAKPKKSAAQLEKEKALANPYPNDFGPEKIDEEIKDYPADKKEGYRLLLLRCTQCHASSRPLNSRFVEPSVGADLKPADRTAKEQEAVAEMKSQHPDWFKDSGSWQIEADVWNRYVKRMLNKPGCGVAAGGHMTNEEAKKIYQFLVYDGQKRKLGDNAEKWKAHRQKLIEKLKAEKPARYEELAKDKDL